MRHFSNNLSDKLETLTLKQVKCYRKHIQLLVEAIIKDINYFKISITSEEMEILKRMPNIHHGIAVEVLEEFFDKEYSLLKNTVLSKIEEIEEMDLNDPDEPNLYLIWELERLIY